MITVVCRSGRVYFFECPLSELRPKLAGLLELLGNEDSSLHGPQVDGTFAIIRTAEIESVSADISDAPEVPF